MLMLICPWESWW
ncbi:UNVERIFIED_CONTAM: hypothetical protein GTU68_038960 [Idotea baltica]|nr:hypothetical protein [Idotea baltica]